MANRRVRLSFPGLILHNVGTRPVRTVLTATAVALGITAVVALGVLTFSLRETAVSILRTGRADFTVAQKGVSDVLYSSINEDDLATLRSQPGVGATVGVLVNTATLGPDRPFFLEIGIPPDQQADFGVTVVDGRSYTADAPDEIMLGVGAARDLGKGVGDQLTVEERTFRVVGLYTTGVDIGDAGAMFPLTTLQEWQRKPGIVTVAFVQARPGADIDQVRAGIEHAMPQFATVRSESEFGRVDRNLVLINAANIGGSILALIIGATGVMNTSLLSFFERIREFGVLRAVGWSRRRVLSLVLGEAFVVSLLGAAVGVVVGVALVKALQRLPDLRGVFDPRFTADIFGRALLFAVAMTFLGALYPALRAARISPLRALRRE